MSQIKLDVMKLLSLSDSVLVFIIWSSGDLERHKYFLKRELKGEQRLAQLAVST